MDADAVLVEGRAMNVLYIDLPFTSLKKNDFLLIRLHYQKLNPATSLLFVLSARCTAVKDTQKL